MKKQTKYKHSSIKNTKFINSEDLYHHFLDKNSMLVKIHDQIDFSFVNDICDDIYVEEGQHAYLPELVFRVSFIQYLKGGISDNEIVRQCKTNLEYRYFCNLAIDDDVFDDCKLSRFRKDLGEKRFKEIFEQIVKKVQVAGLISKNDVQYMDSFLFLADVKVISINALLTKSINQVLADLKISDTEIEQEQKKRDFELSEEQQKQRFVFLVKKAQTLLSSAKKKTNLPPVEKSLSVLQRIVKERAEINDQEVRKKETGEEKDKIVNTSDIDARMMTKNNQNIVPRYKSFVSMNKIGFITATDVTLATVYDGHHTPILIHDLKNRGYTVPQCVGDTHFGDIELRKSMMLENTQMIAPYRKNQVINSCCTEEIMIEAWSYNHTQEYKEHLRIRAHIEPKQGEMKNFHGMKRARFRGLEKMKIQNYLSAIVTNCKKLVATAS